MDKALQALYPRDSGNTLDFSEDLEMSSIFSDLVRVRINMDDYKSREDLDVLMADLLRDMSHEAEMRHCYIEAEAWEQGTEYRW